jgi:uncharacterized protein involved in exopolysaccharide biosynthesis
VASDPIVLPMRRTPDDPVLRYLLTILPYWRILSLVVLISVTLTALWTMEFATPFFQASAVLRPVSRADQGSWLAGSLSNLSGGLSSFLGLSDEEKFAEEYISIMQSYEFTMQVLGENDLRQELMNRSITHRWFGWEVSDYRLYTKMSKLFNADYDLKTGNITLTFQDPDPKQAERVLSSYITILRNKLRTREIESADAAIRAMQKAVNDVRDAQVQALIYSAIANQIQRREMSEVQADFSLKTIDSPVAPDKPNSPKTLLDCIAVAAVSFVFAWCWILMKVPNVVESKRPGVAWAAVDAVETK